MKQYIITYIVEGDNRYYMADMKVDVWKGRSAQSVMIDILHKLVDHYNAVSNEGNKTTWSQIVIINSMEL